MAEAAGGALSGRVAIVTGGAKGQGSAACRLFVTEGAHVIIADTDIAAGELLADELGMTARFEQMDISLEEDWARVVTGCMARHGRVDILLNNAAIYGALPLQETSTAEFERFWRVNQLGPFLGMRYAGEAMKGRGGSIINVSSIVAQGGYPANFAYATSKWAVRGMTKCAARDLGPVGIRVNSILPGVIQTDMISHLSQEAANGLLPSIPLGRLGDVIDVARVALFLASDASAYLSGAELVVDAGMTA